MQKSTPEDRAKAVCDRLGALKTERASYESTWQEIADYVCPRKADIAADQSAGAVRTDRLSDVTAIHANDTLGAGQLAYVCPANEFWFKIQSRDEKVPDAVAQWLENATQVMFNELAGSNFYLEIHEHFLDRGSMGTACIYLQEGRRSTLTFKNIPVGTFYIEEDCEGVVDTVYREFKWTARQAAQKFGAAALHEELQKALVSNDPAQIARPWDFIHAVEPREGLSPRRRDNRGKPYASYWVDVAHRHLVREAGYDEMPYFVSRFLKTKADKYGYSPAWSALPLIKQLNKIEDDLDALGEKAAFPPVLAPFDGAFEIDLRPGGITYYDATQPESRPREWQTQGRYDIGQDRAAQKRGQIERMFFNDLFNMMNRLDKQMTAREVAERSAEKLVQFSPTFARMITELFSPLLTRVFAICLRRGLFGEPPKEMASYGRAIHLDYKIDYVSKIAMAIKSLETRAFLQLMDTLAPAAQLAPQVFDNIDFDTAARGLARNLSVPTRWMRPQKDVQADRQARAQAQAQAQQARLMMQGAAAFGKLPERVTDAVVDEAKQAQEAQE